MTEAIGLEIHISGYGLFGDFTSRDLDRLRSEVKNFAAACDCSEQDASLIGPYLEDSVEKCDRFEGPLSSIHFSSEPEGAHFSYLMMESDFGLLSLALYPQAAWPHIFGASNGMMIMLGIMLGHYNRRVIRQNRLQEFHDRLIHFYTSTGASYMCGGRDLNFFDLAFKQGIPEGYRSPNSSYTYPVMIVNRADSEAAGDISQIEDRLFAYRRLEDGSTFIQLSENPGFVREPDYAVLADFLGKKSFYDIY
ncbi:MAG: hypothetical protein AAF492_10065 [Verrucomicrobiota bacterium]